MAFRLDHRVALITGAGSENGIGRAIVLDVNGFIVGYVSLNDLGK